MLVGDCPGTTGLALGGAAGGGAAGTVTPPACGNGGEAIVPPLGLDFCPEKMPSRHCCMVLARGSLGVAPGLPPRFPVELGASGGCGVPGTGPGLVML